MDIHNINDVEAFITKDGSEIRELLAHRNSCIRKQSLAEARVPPNAVTAAHRHPLTEEIYYILEGQGVMSIAGEECQVIVPYGFSYELARRCHRHSARSRASDSQYRAGVAEVPLLLCARL